MTDQEKGELIGAIIEQLRQAAKKADKHFDAGDVFFSLAFKADSQLKQIAKAASL